MSSFRFDRYIEILIFFNLFKNVKSLFRISKYIITLLLKQLRKRNGILFVDILTPSIIEYKLKERTTIAKLLFESFIDLTEDQIIQKWIELIQNLIQFCKHQESLYQYQIAKSKKQFRKYITNFQILLEDTDSNLIMISLISNIITRFYKLSKIPILFYIFCKWNDNKTGPKKQKYKYLYIDNLNRYIKT
ncbi:hypothetical protein EAF04_005704 [Stromatinia cepivora]|nr:hypothetical protein EAF04_005704 [Stromatinia cepivora]